MRRLNTLLLVIVLFVFAPSVQAAVVINEIGPKYADASWEWVELYNTGAASVSLDRWKVDHTAGDAKSYILNASAIIQPYGFLTLTGSQTSISFSVDGDTVRLFDANGNLADSKNYPGTLGYNTSMGRSTDGGDGWVMCAPDPYISTPNAHNNCPPAPIPTATPTPAPTPTSTPRPTATPVPAIENPPKITSASIPVQQSFGSVMTTPTGTQVLGAIDAPTPTPTVAEDVLLFKIPKTWIAYILLGIAAAALSYMLVLYLRRRHFRQ